MDYLDFEIEIAPGDRVNYPLAVIHSPAGEIRTTSTLPFSQIELENRILTLKNVILRSGGQHRRALTSDELTVRDFGQDLFDALFSDDVGSLYHESRRQAERQDAGLRIQSPELAALPWEFLFDRRSDEFVCLSTSTPLVRYLETSAPVRPLAVKPPLRVLWAWWSAQMIWNRSMSTSSANGWTGHWRHSSHADWFNCIGWKAKPGAIFNVACVRSSGTSSTSSATAPTTPSVTKVSSPLPTAMARLLTDHSTLRLALLNSCEGARAGELDLLSSTAATLVRRGLPAVLAMQYDITDMAAIQLSEAFYEALVDGLPVDGALAEARKAISLGIANSLEWGTPALSMRSGDGRIFDIDQTELTAEQVVDVGIGLAVTTGKVEQGKAAATPDQEAKSNEAIVGEPLAKKEAARPRCAAWTLLLFTSLLAVAASIFAWRYLSNGGVETATATVVPSERASDGRPGVAAGCCRFGDFLSYTHRDAHFN